MAHEKINDLWRELGALTDQNMTCDNMLRRAYDENVSGERQHRQMVSGGGYRLPVVKTAKMYVIKKVLEAMTTKRKTVKWSDLAGLREDYILAMALGHLLKELYSEELRAVFPPSVRKWVDAWDYMNEVAPDRKKD